MKFRRSRQVERVLTYRLIDHQGHASSIAWHALPPSEHFVQVYPNDQVFLDVLEGYVAGGLRAGEGVVVIATPLHLDLLAARLTAAGFDLTAAAAKDKYVALDAERTLRSFMIRGWPDEILFEHVISRVLERAGRDGRRVRAFGEMVVLLWNEGRTGATICLEQLWHSLCRRREFSLFCAYPRSSFADNTDLSIEQIYATHSKVLQN
jgi:hypothetical protein